MRIGDRDILMHRGWVVQYHDGRVFCEDDMPWQKLPEKKNIRRVILKWNDRFWSLDDKEHYVAPTRREVIDIQLGGISPSVVHSRTIGYYSMEENCKVILRVEESTGKPNWETLPF